MKLEVECYQFREERKPAGSVNSLKNALEYAFD